MRLRSRGRPSVAVACRRHPPELTVVEKVVCCAYLFGLSGLLDLLEVSSETPESSISLATERCIHLGCGSSGGALKPAVVRIPSQYRSFWEKKMGPWGDDGVIFRESCALVASITLKRPGWPTVTCCVTFVSVTAISHPAPREPQLSFHLDFDDDPLQVLGPLDSCLERTWYFV